MKGKGPKNPANRQTYRELTRTVQRGICQDSVWNIHQQSEEIGNHPSTNGFRDSKTITKCFTPRVAAVEDDNRVVLFEGADNKDRQQEFCK